MITTLPMTPKRVDRLTAYVKSAPRGQESGVHVHVKECVVCGHLTWVSSQVHPNKADEKGSTTFSAEPGSPYECPDCMKVSRRNPELFQWVINVVGNRSEELLASFQNSLQQKV